MRGLHLFLVVVALGCSNNPDATCDGGACVDAGAVPPVSGGGCDSSKPASQGGCAVADVDGFFVSPSGSDAADGSKATPFLTIGKGIAAASAAALKPNVYVCQGTYAENLTIQNAPAGVALHGGFDCASWTQVSAPTTVAPAYVAGQYVLHVAGAAALVESITLTAPDATDPGASSVAVLVDGSPGMTLRRAAVTAGKGADGASPTPPIAAAAASNGNDGGFQIFGSAKVCPCTSDSSTGGQGGGATDAGVQNPEAGAPLVSGYPTSGQPGTQGGSPACNGGSGANGLDGTAGASTGTLGELTANGWTASAGGPGTLGGTGQGGAGGWWNAGSPSYCGGSGACGGCGGAGGVGGSGGGASIAVGAINSTLRIQASTIHAGQGGSGGKGSAGQAGQPGGTGGVGNPCNGGVGGTGGAGGVGGGGAGGVSVAIATSTTTPDIDSFSTIVAGTAGQGGLDGAGVSKAVDGVAETVHAF